MTETMQKLCAKRAELLNIGNSLNVETETDKFKANLEELRKLDEAITEQEKFEAQAKGANMTLAMNGKSDGFKIIANALKRGEFKNAAGDVLKTGGLNGEDYLLPEDVKLEINKYKEEQLSAKFLVNTIETYALNGSFNWGKNPSDGLIEFADGDEVDSSVLPEFVQQKWTAKWIGAAIPITTILQGAEQAGLMPFINYWFSRRTVIKENEDIFAAFKANYNDGTPLTLADEAALRKSINVDLDPAFVQSSYMKIVTNQTGFDYLDQLKDESGRDLLQPDPTKPTQKLYKGHPIYVFSDKQLPNVDGAAPIIYGATNEGIWFMDYQDYYFDTDNGKGIGFLKNTAYLKVLEAYAVCPADTSSYIYGLLATA